MGLSSAPTATESLKFCIFDLRRGQQEGQELDKILFFFPAHLPFSTQLSVIGLSEGLITFTRLDLLLPLFHKAQPNGLLQLLEFSILARNLKSQHFFFTQNFLSRGCLWGNRSREALSCVLWGRTRYLDGYGKPPLLSSIFFGCLSKKKKKLLYLF